MRRQHSPQSHAGVRPASPTPVPPVLLEQQELLPDRDEMAVEVWHCPRLSALSVCQPSGWRGGPLAMRRAPRHYGEATRRSDTG